MTSPGPRRLPSSDARSIITGSYIARACKSTLDPIMDMKVQGSRSGKVLGIAELLTSTCSASATLDRP